MKCTTLTKKINEFMKSIDPYEYNDTVEDEREFIVYIYNSIRYGDTEAIETYLQDFIAEDGLKKDIDKAKELLKEIKKWRTKP